MPAKKKTKKPSPARPADDRTGTYKFDPELGKVVKISSDIPSVASKGGDKPSCGDPSSPCASDACGMGGCGMGGCGID